MSKINDGGPAFPCPAELISKNGELITGMTLRDWFAGMALLNNYTNSGNENGSVGPRDVASWAYELADFMIKTRKEGAA